MLCCMLIDCHYHLCISIMHPLLIMALASYCTTLYTFYSKIISLHNVLLHVNLDWCYISYGMIACHHAAGKNISCGEGLCSVVCMMHLYENYSLMFSFSFCSCFPCYKQLLWTPVWLLVVVFKVSKPNMGTSMCMFTCFAVF